MNNNIKLFRRKLRRYNYIRGRQTNLAREILMSSKGAWNQYHIMGAPFMGLLLFRTPKQLDIIVTVFSLLFNLDLWYNKFVRVMFTIISRISCKKHKSKRTIKNILLNRPYLARSSFLFFDFKKDILI